MEIFSLLSSHHSPGISGKNCNHLSCSVLCIIWSAEVNRKGSSCYTAVMGRTSVHLRVALKPKNLFKEGVGQLLQTSEVVVLGAVTDCHGQCLEIQAILAMKTFP